jgi:hypothetical protein
MFSNLTVYQLQHIWLICRLSGVLIMCVELRGGLCNIFGCIEGVHITQITIQ